MFLPKTYTQVMLMSHFLKHPFLISAYLLGHSVGLEIKGKNMSSRRALLKSRAERTPGS